MQKIITVSSCLKFSQYFTKHCKKLITRAHFNERLKSLCKSKQGIVNSIYAMVIQINIRNSRRKKNGFYSKVTSKLHIAESIACNEGLIKIDIREIILCHQTHARIRF